MEGIQIPDSFAPDPVALRDYIVNFQTRSDDVFVVSYPKSGKLLNKQNPSPRLCTKKTEPETSFCKNPSRFLKLFLAETWTHDILARNHITFPVACSVNFLLYVFVPIAVGQSQLGTNYLVMDWHVNLSRYTTMTRGSVKVSETCVVFGIARWLAVTSLSLALTSLNHWLLMFALLREVCINIVSCSFIERHFKLL